MIATPGRLLDLYAQRHVSFEHVSILVLDEADRMLDMGFIRDVRKIVAACRKERQTLLFSATMPSGHCQTCRRDSPQPRSHRYFALPKSPSIASISGSISLPAQAKRGLLTELLA